MLTSIYSRIILSIIIAIAILNGWWFIAVPVLIFGTWLFSFSLEWIVAGVIYDALFGMAPGMGLWGYAGTITAVCAFIASRLLKKMLRTHDRMIV
jgi:hypothetical protein